MCHLAHRDNLKRQETFSCTNCGYTALADFNAACNLKARADDTDLLKCQDKAEIKALLAARHALWRENPAARSAVARLVSEPSSFNRRRIAKTGQCNI